MIVSHKHKFIFVKTKKTAGTSIEIALSRICGSEDIITPISTIDEKYRLSLGYRSSQNYNISILKYSKKEIAKFIYHLRRPTYYNHMSSIEIKRILGKSIWDEYFTFCFERNPFDKFISWFYWCGGYEKYESFQTFITSGLAYKMGSFDLYTELGNIIVDKVYKYENLLESMNDIGRKLNNNIYLPKNKTKSNTRPENTKYYHLLSSKEIDWISKAFAREIAFFNYTV